MRILIRHPRVLHDGSNKGVKLFEKGQHEISDEVAEHWFTQALMKSGDISVIAEMKEKSEKQEKSDKKEPAKVDEKPKSSKAQ